MVNWQYLTQSSGFVMCWSFQRYDFTPSDCDVTKSLQITLLLVERITRSDNLQKIKWHSISCQISLQVKCVTPIKVAWSDIVTLPSLQVTSLLWSDWSMTKAVNQWACWMISSCNFIGQSWTGTPFASYYQCLFLCHPTSNFLSHIRHTKVWRQLSL